MSLLSKCLVLFWYLTVLYSLRAISNHNKTNKGTEKSPEITKNACFKKEEDDNDDKKVTSNKSRFEEIYKYPSFDIMWPCRFNNFYDVCDRWGVWWGQFVSLMFLSQCLKSLPLSLSSISEPMKIEYENTSFQATYSWHKHWFLRHFVWSKVLNIGPDFCAFQQNPEKLPSLKRTKPKEKPKQGIGRFSKHDGKFKSLKLGTLHLCSGSNSFFFLHHFKGMAPKTRPIDVRTFIKHWFVANSEWRLKHQQLKIDLNLFMRTLNAHHFEAPALRLSTATTVTSTYIMMRFILLITFVILKCRRRRKKCHSRCFF